MARMDTPAPIKHTPLYDFHVSLQAKMVPFAGYAMPVQYPLGMLKEHLHTRAAAGLFDISHMGQLWIEGGTDIRTQLEKIMPGDFAELQPGQTKYSFLLNENGGVIDDLMVTRPAAPNEQNAMYVVINASGREVDFAHIQKHLPNVKTTLLDRSLLALQGPAAAAVLTRFCDAPSKLSFMTVDKFNIPNIGECIISRSGYTGEDGFEISVPNETVENFARALCAEPEVQPIGLGARDSLRLEAGLCLYGHDLDENTTPIEANLLWAIGKRRRAEGGFIGAEKILQQIKNGTARKRVGIQPESRALAREQTPIHDTNGNAIGLVTSGGFGPTVDAPVCMGYVDTPHAAVGTQIFLMVRGKPVAARIVTLPFTPNRYFRKGSS